MTTRRTIDDDDEETFVLTASQVSIASPVSTIDILEDDKEGLTDIEPSDLDCKRRRLDCVLEHPYPDEGNTGDLVTSNHCDLASVLSVICR